MKDVFGTAILDYQQGKYTEDLVTSTSISEEDTLPLPYLFRDFKEMPLLEQTALKQSKGSVLDVGCGAGSHSLYLKSKGLNVKSIDISEGAIKTCQLRGLEHAQVLDVMDETQTFDTLLLLMNGSGIFQSLAHTPFVLKHLKTLLNPNGQILIDSSDIKYMYEEDDGGFWMDTNKEYYGELDYTVRYKDEEATFSWMYLDFERLKIACDQIGLQCELVKQGPHYDFLAKLTQI
ncbi:methyltransferase domain-containing protein [Flavobacteriaceae bacterium]|nr:methyltransferase domain-containing protein [Flavobacteriaceae bacterium]